MGAKGSPVIVLCINNFQTQEKICFKDSTHVSIAKCTKTRAEKWKIESKFKKKRTNIHKNCVKFLETYFVGYKSRELPSSSWCLYSIRCTTMRVRRYFGSTIIQRQPPGRSLFCCGDTVTSASRVRGSQWMRSPTLKHQRSRCW